MNYYIFHHNDLDGRCAASVVLGYLKNNMGVPDPIIKETDYNHLNELSSLIKGRESISSLCSFLSISRYLEIYWKTGGYDDKIERNTF